MTGICSSGNLLLKNDTTKEIFKYEVTSTGNFLNLKGFHSGEYVQMDFVLINNLNLYQLKEDLSDMEYKVQTFKEKIKQMEKDILTKPQKEKK